jgi:hypothetical protein
MWIALSDFVGTTSNISNQYAVRTGDRIINYSWKDGQDIGIGFNQRTGLGGHFPAKTIAKAPRQPTIPYELVVFTESL